MTARLTYHAQERILDRLQGLVTVDEVTQACSCARLVTGENYIPVKRFGHRIYLGNPSDPDTPKGDVIIAKVVKDNRGETIITVMLRKSTSTSDRYS